uniref:Uncharacterized protein n=1 Tax=Trypanosoma congolense (strain IL3000) TaxID=1068625 RepID=G0UU73_TRYCI|nr:conserved hypothetical protein [Trypanosoma congolense IL3000]
MDTGLGLYHPASTCWRYPPHHITHEFLCRFLLPRTSYGSLFLLYFFFLQKYFYEGALNLCTRSGSIVGRQDMSDDEDDVIVLQVCANKQCLGIEDLEFDETTGEMYCAKCRELYDRAAREGFSILLSADDVDVVHMIFKRFDEGKGWWTYKDFVRFLNSTQQPPETDINSQEDLKAFFKEEYDIDLALGSSGEYVIRVKDLEEMYGGFAYNNINALHKDCDVLESAGLINTAVLE